MGIGQKGHTLRPNALLQVTNSVWFISVDAR
nr:MAG TPA: hypothetical protein [Caudoviricetes sp.]